MEHSPKILWATNKARYSNVLSDWWIRNEMNNVDMRLKHFPSLQSSSQNHRNQRIYNRRSSLLLRAGESLIPHHITMVLPNWVFETSKAGDSFTTLDTNSNATVSLGEKVFPEVQPEPPKLWFTICYCWFNGAGINFCYSELAGGEGRKREEGSRTGRSKSKISTLRKVGKHPVRTT